MNYKKYIAEKIKVDGVPATEIEGAIALPPNTEMGDYALPCFKFAKAMRKSPVAIAQELAAQIKPDDVIS
ncbi:MAG: arginine--tRNA ligase, partial [Clostridia bacterium]|nr:arginine--tRNA ligase [Clostridia bacterium]